MNNPKLYKLELNDNSVIVYRTDNDIGRIGTVFSDTMVRFEYMPYRIPKYIQRKAFSMMEMDKD